METEIIRRLKEMSALMNTRAEEDKNVAYPKHLQAVDLDSLKKVDGAVKGDMIQKIDEISRMLGKAAVSSKLIRQQCRLGNLEKEAAGEEVETAEIAVPEIPEEPSEKRENFRVLMDVSNFKQHTVKVDIFEKKLVVRGQHDDLFDAHGTTSREFTRKFEIPAEVDIETFRALIDCYGVLTIEASFEPVDIEYQELELLLDAHDPTKLWAFKDIGSGFRLSAKRHILDGMDLGDFVEKLVKQYPSSYIPYEQVV